MSRLPDKVQIVLLDKPGQAASEPGSGTVFDLFTSLLITNDITAPSEAAFELGDDGSWGEIEQYVVHGAEYSVFINNLLRLTGRVELNDNPLDAQAGSVVRFTVRTKLMDAQYASASEATKVRDVSIEDFVLALYAPLGYVKSDFVFRGSTARDLITGKESTNQGDDAPKDLEPIKVEAAKVRPPESIYSAADRHLRRHGLMHWDSPDGRIVVSAPNDEQDPLYSFVMKRANRGAGNNVMGTTRTQDWSGIPSAVKLYGVGGKRGTTKTRVYATAEDEDVAAAGFHRPVTIIAEAVRTNELAQRSANRELSARSKQKDAFDIEVDGLSWWSGSEQIPYGVDTVAEIITDVAGGGVGAYYLHRVASRRDTANGDVSTLSLVRKGVWRL